MSADSQRAVLIGLDAGGTRPCACSPTSTPRPRRGARRGANLQAAGELEVEKILHEVMDRAIGDRLVAPSAIALGMAGVDRADDWQVNAPASCGGFGFKRGR
jgi:N-acetylglucosamine kinase-like BadF-type ATPase